ncbi:MAG: 4-hydroxy-3-methylbut-2-enyl diphosphate reductase [Candidatus Cloacimonadaceae bacterium]
MKKPIIAIDGPAASGKSTTARLLAARLGLVYLDTGAMYRACALQAERLAVPLDDLGAIEALMDEIELRVEFEGGMNRIFLGDEDVSRLIRSEHISQQASAISAQPSVRLKMVELQRKIASGGGFILDGRDIGSYVFPDADFKFFLVADAEIRAQRRFDELKSRGLDVDYQEVLEDINRRDKNDAGRALAPLIKMPDAIEVDTGNLTIEEQVNVLYDVIMQKRGNAKIYLAEHSGFCFGVRRAIQMATEAKGQGQNVCTLGELIHNPVVVKQLAAQGIVVCDDPTHLENHTVIIRSHGAPREIYEALEASGNTVVDATCPYVKRAQQLVQEMSAKDYQVIIMGDEHHPEVVGMRSWGNGSTLVLAPGSTPELVLHSKVCIVCQTTKKPEDLAAMSAWFSTKVQELRIFNTICLATQQRQKATADLAQHADVMIVIGGQNSSNTMQLFHLCQRYCHCHKIETEAEIQPQWLEGKKIIGLAAGASTPSQTILSVYNRIKEINGEPERVTTIGEVPLYKEESC